MQSYYRFFKFSAIFIWLCARTSFAADWAVVQSAKALVFADPEMSSPVGYFKKGQKLRVGEVARNEGRVLPTVFKKRIVYVRVADLETSEDLSLVRSATQRIFEKKEKPGRQTRLGVFYGVSAASASGLQTVEGEQNFNDSSESFGMSSVGFFGQTRENQQDEQWLRFKVEYASGSKRGTSLSSLLLSGGLSKELASAGSFVFSLYGDASLIPWSQYEVGTLFKINGYGAGAGAGGQVSWQAESSWFLQFEGGYQFVKLAGFNPPQAEGVDTELAPLLSGFSAGIVAGRSF